MSKLGPMSANFDIASSCSENFEKQSCLCLRFFSFKANITIVGHSRILQPDSPESLPECQAQESARHCRIVQVLVEAVTKDNGLQAARQGRVVQALVEIVSKFQELQAAR